MRVQAGKYIRKFQENAIVSGIIIEEPHIGINQENEVTGISWMHISEVTPMSQTKNDSKRETFFINYRS